MALIFASCSNESSENATLTSQALAKDYDFKTLLSLTEEAYLTVSRSMQSISQDEITHIINNLVVKTEQKEFIKLQELDEFAKVLGFKDAATLDATRIAIAHTMKTLMDRYEQDIFTEQDLLIRAIEQVKTADLIRSRGGCRDCCERFRDLCWNQTYSAFWMNSAGSIGGWALAGAYVGGGSGGSLSFGTLTIPGAIVGGVVGGTIGFGTAMWNYTVSNDECDYKFERCIDRCGTKNDIKDCDF